MNILNIEAASRMAHTDYNAAARPMIANAMNETLEAAYNATTLDELIKLEDQALRVLLVAAGAEIEL